MAKQQTNIRLSPYSKAQLRALAARMGLSEGQLIMLAVDRLARDEGLTPRTQLWKQSSSGKVYAVRALGSEVLDAAGPLSEAEQVRALKQGFDGDAKLAEDIQTTTGDYELIELEERPQ